MPRKLEFSHIMGGFYLYERQEVEVYPIVPKDGDLVSIVSIADHRDIVDQELEKLGLKVISLDDAAFGCIVNALKYPEEE